MSSSTTSTSANNNNSKPPHKNRRTDAASSIILPVSFVPGIYEVIIGRGRQCTEHYGNLRFKSIVEYELEAYSAAQCKREKSAVIGRVLELVKQRSPAGFVKKDVVTGHWLSLNQAASRVTIVSGFLLRYCAVLNFSSLFGSHFLSLLSI